jgi:hypothetical protein
MAQMKERLILIGCVFFAVAGVIAVAANELNKGIPALLIAVANAILLA